MSQSPLRLLAWPLGLAACFWLSACASNPYSSAVAPASSAGEAISGPARGALYVSSDLFNVGAWIAPPPEEGSAQQRTELEELRTIEAKRTMADLAIAVRDDRQMDIFIFSDVMGLRFSSSNLPQTAELGRQVRQDVTLLDNAAKAHFKRPRPWVVDPNLIGCPLSVGRPSNAAYPSGHAANGYGFGIALAAIVPEKADAIMARAKSYAYSRMICGLHFRSDVEASVVVAAVAVQDMMNNPRFRAQLDAARRELQSAGLASR